MGPKLDWTTSKKKEMKEKLMFAGAHTNRKSKKKGVPLLLQEWGGQRQAHCPKLSLIQRRTSHLQAMDSKLCTARSRLLVDDYVGGTSKLRVHLPVRGALIPGCYLELELGKVKWVDFRYEGVYVVCTHCGNIGHKESHCKKNLQRGQRKVS
ncbi:Ion-translocating oxidoreductase complex subunit E [Bienertia sinuspersici]